MQPRLTRPVQVGRVLGVPIYFAPSWLIVAVLVTATFADIFERAVDGTGPLAGHLLALAYAVLLAGCVLLHELGHVAVAVALRLKVQRVVIFLLGGASEIVPEPQRPRDELAVSLAGPIVSAVLAAAAWWLTTWTAPRTALDVELQLLLWSNLSIAVFNALPGLPLDGGRALRAAVHGAGVNRLLATKIAAWAGRVIAALVAASGLLVTRASWDLVTVAMSTAIGAFLWFGATNALLAARLAERIPRLTVAALLRPAVWVPADLPVSEALRWAGEQHARAIVLLDSHERPLGVVEDAMLAGLPYEQRPWTPVAEVAAPVPPGAELSADLTGEQLLQACERTPAQYYVVLDAARHPIGVVSSADVRATLKGTRPVTASAR